MGQGRKVCGIAWNTHKCIKNTCTENQEISKFNMFWNTFALAHSPPALGGCNHDGVLGHSGSQPFILCKLGTTDN